MATKAKQRLKETAVQGLHLFQRRFDYSGQQMPRGTERHPLGVSWMVHMSVGAREKSEEEMRRRYGRPQLDTDKKTAVRNNCRVDELLY